MAWAVRLATRPLAQLAQAADRLGADPQAEVLPPLDAAGPAEVRRAHAAFQAMQAQAAQAAPAAPPLDAQNAAYAAQMGFQAPQQ